jgi:hypothetical protein
MKDEHQNELIALCLGVGLNLVSIGPLPTETNTSEAIFKILFIVACVALVIAFILLGILFFNRSE